MTAWTDTQFWVLSIGCLLLALIAYRGQRIGAKKTVVIATAWLAIFLLVAVVFVAIGGAGR